jgi:hypothetical protein
MQTKMNFMNVKQTFLAALLLTGIMMGCQTDELTEENALADQTQHTNQTQPTSTAASANARTASYSFYDNTIAPANSNSTTDPNPVEVGMKFKSSQKGKITSLRFYRGQADLGANFTVSLWNATGGLLAVSTNNNNTGSPISGLDRAGWYTVDLGTRAASINANEIYVVSYYTSNGRYAIQEQGLANDIVSGPLTALGGVSNGGNGVYTYNVSNSFPFGGFPNQSYNNSNYFVDVLFEPEAAPAPSNVNINVLGNQTPITAVDSDNAGVQVGVKFKSSIDGYISNIRFYRGKASGSYTVNLWKSDGTLLASQFVSEGQAPTPGWQVVGLIVPRAGGGADRYVPIVANQVYIASYYVADGGYASDEQGLANDITNGNLTLLGGTANGGNGVYKYGTTSNIFPNESYNNTNYWVDVQFTTTR